MDSSARQLRVTTDQLVRSRVWWSSALAATSSIARIRATPRFTEGKWPRCCVLVVALSDTATAEATVE
jgi:hypothetical protein